MSDLTFELILTKIKGFQLGGQTGYSFRQYLNNKLHIYIVQ